MNRQTLTANGSFYPGAPEAFVPGLPINFKLFSAARQALHARRASRGVSAMGREEFIRHVTLHLPEVAARIEEDDFGVLHLEMAAMKLATRDALLRFDFHTVRRHFAFISYLFAHADNALQDAIRISYLEALFLDETASEYDRARAFLPELLEEALRHSERYFSLMR